MRIDQPYICDTEGYIIYLDKKPKLWPKVKGWGLGEVEAAMEDIRNKGKVKFNLETVDLIHEKHIQENKISSGIKRIKERITAKVNIFSIR